MPRSFRRLFSCTSRHRVGSRRMNEDHSIRDDAAAEMQQKYYILLKDCSAEKSVRSIIKRTTEATTAVKGSLLFLEKPEWEQAYSNKNKSSELRLHSTDNPDVLVTCRYNEVEQIGQLEHELLAALTTCKEREALYQQKKILRDSLMLYEYCVSSSEINQERKSSGHSSHSSLNGTGEPNKSNGAKKFKEGRVTEFKNRLSGKRKSGQSQRESGIEREESIGVSDIRGSTWSSGGITEELRVMVVDEKGHDDEMSGTLLYAGAVPGKNGVWFAVELDMGFSNERYASSGTFEGQRLFSAQSGCSILVPFKKLRLTSETRAIVEQQRFDTQSRGRDSGVYDASTTSSLYNRQLLASISSNQNEAALRGPASPTTTLRQVGGANANDWSSSPRSIATPEPDKLPSEKLPPVMSETEAAFPKVNRPDLKLNDRIVWLSDDTGVELGVVKWIGVLRDCFTYYTIGVEFDNPVGTGTGHYNGKQLFTARQNHASLIPTIGLIKAEEYYGHKSLVPPPPSPPDTGSLPRTLPSAVEAQIHRNFTTATDSATSGAVATPTNSRTCRQPVMPPSEDQIRRPPLSAPIRPPGSSPSLDVSDSIEPSSLRPRPQATPYDSHLTSLITPHNPRSQAGIMPEDLMMDNDEETMERRVEEPMTLTSAELGTDMENGSMVEVEIPGSNRPEYGVVSWMGYLLDRSRPMVGVELEEENPAGTDGRFGRTRLFHCPPRRGFFTPLHRVKKDKRFVETSSFLERPNEFGSVMFDDLEGIYDPREIPTSSQLSSVLGKKRGIQGHHNSCYMDVCLYSMFMFSRTFDTLLHRPRRAAHDIDRYNEIQRCLRTGIVNPLRHYGYVTADKVLLLRRLLNDCGKVKGLMNEEKDPDEFLGSLLNDTLRAEPFLKLSSGQSSHFYQLFVDPDRAESLNMPTTQQLLSLSFFQSNIKLREVPSCLILQMPRFGRDFNLYKRVVPSLTLNITTLLETCLRLCYICGDPSTIECRDCLEGSDLERMFYCESCSKKTHSHVRRRNHRPIKCVSEDYTTFTAPLGGASSLIDSSPTPPPQEELELFAIICIKTSHYVSFSRAGHGPKAPWVFFDSMADRIGAQHGYNVPEVKECPYLPDWLENDKRDHILQISDDRDLPELVRRILCDGYICMYREPSLEPYC